MDEIGKEHELFGILRRIDENPGDEVFMDLYRCVESSLLVLTDATRRRRGLRTELTGRIGLLNIRAEHILGMRRYSVTPRFTQATSNPRVRQYTVVAGLLWEPAYTSVDYIGLDELKRP